MQGQRVRSVVMLLVLQALAASFFLADTILDAQTEADGEGVLLSGLEVGLAVALLASIAVGAAVLRQMMRDAQAREQTLALARGAIAEVAQQRFASWGLSRAEADVALFALKGSSIAEIARMRGSAEGTVRAQLSQVYAKAGVSSQPMFVALFIEELLGA